MGAVHGPQAGLAGAQRLPGGGRGQRRALCKEAANLLFAGKLSQNCSVPEDAPVHKASERHVRWQQPAEHTTSPPLRDYLLLLLF